MIELSEYVSGAVLVTGDTKRAKTTLRIEWVIQILKQLISMQIF